MHYVLFYELVDDYLKRRTPFREEHLRLAKESQERGELMLAGAFGDPADGAILVFNENNPDAPKEFSRNDPYVKNGLVTKSYVREWMTIIGDDLR